MKTLGRPCFRISLTLARKRFARSAPDLITSPETLKQQESVFAPA
jgi:hypothetical protein